MSRFRYIFLFLAMIGLGLGCGEQPETVSTGGYGVPGDSDDGDDDDGNSDQNGNQNSGTNGSTTTNNGATNADGNNANTETNGMAGTNGTTGTNGTNNGTTGTNNGTTAGPEFHPMFVAVADFMREKCVNCHDQGQNGNFVLESPDATNQQVRDAIDDVEATTGRLMIEPNNPDESQVYIMITNDAGEQFDDATIAIVEDWINAGAPYTP